MAPITLLVLDGWGVTDKTEGNAIRAAKTPNYKQMLELFPNSLLDASGAAVGLPIGLMGNSEVGHLTIGSGRVVIQKLTQISETIADGTFFTNPVLMEALERARINNGAVHIFGLLSDGCVHSSLDHLYALIDMAKRENVPEIVVHPILDGRDTPPRSAFRFVRDLEKKLAGIGVIGVVCGRYYAMDRDNRWERTQKFYDAVTVSAGIKAETAQAAVQHAYNEMNTGDEFVEPHIVTPRPIKDGDSVICFNFRPDRVRQISKALTQPIFDGFERPAVPQVYYACLTEYDKSLNLPVVFAPEDMPSQDLVSTLPEILSCHHIGQLHTAETEKYAHVTYFFNGGMEKPLEGEERVLIPSLKVATYDKSPPMQTAKVCATACDAINSGAYPFIVLNFANPDMVGHTGIMEAGIEAVESVDNAFGELLEATRKAKGTLLITADHGNIEQLIDYETKEPHTAHTTNPVPFVVADFSGKIRNGANLIDGTLADVAPTILELLSIDKPAEMTGKPLLRNYKF